MMMMTISLDALASFTRVSEVFAAPIGEPPDLPPDLQPMVREIVAWDAEARRSLARYADDSVYRRAIGLGVMIGDAIRLQRSVRTRRIDEWLTDAPADAVAAFEHWRDAFFTRCDAIAALGTEGLVASELAMPEDGVLRMVRHNPSRLARLLAGRSSFLASVSVLRAAAVLVVREWDFFGSFVARQLRRAGLPLSARKARRAIARLNAESNHPLITRRHAEPLLLAYEALGERGVSESAADRVILRALDYGYRSSGKPWKGLTRLTELLVYSGVDPNSPDWTTIFDTACVAPVDYTHVPGREWIVRDYRLGRHLLQIDGKIAPGDRWAGLQQGRGSLSTGYLRAGQERIEFGRRYSKSLAAFLDSMVVAEGADHQRQRKAFLPFLSQPAILEHAAFVESTVSSLLDHAADVARRNDGAFDYRIDFAYEFPIRVICRMLELPAEDVPSVQHWAEASVRSMDTEAGLTYANSREGQRAADELRAYLEGKLALARAGEFTGRVIRSIAHDETLSEAERVANLGVVIFAGFETTTGLLSKGVETLLRHPAQWAYLRDALVPATPATVDGTLIRDLEWRWLAWASQQPDRNVDVARRDRLAALAARSPEAASRAGAIRRQEEALDRAVEELLRWTAPGTVVPLTASKDLTVPIESAMTVKGCPHAPGTSLTIKRGETIAVAVDELNRRCPVGAGHFDGGEPSLLDVSRTDNTSHLSFGLRHSCIGAFLAKENAKRAFEGTLRRFPDLELNGVPIPQEMELFSGLSSLPVLSPAMRQRRARGKTGASSTG
jgi:cytochrome P450